MDQKIVAQLPQELKQKYQDIEEMQILKDSLRKYKNTENQIKVLDPITGKTKQLKQDKFIKLLEKIKDADSNKTTKKKYESVLKEIRESDLSKLTAELAQGIIDCQLHQTNIRFFVELCVMLNSYDDFSSALVRVCKKQIEVLDKKQGNYENEDKRAQKRKNLLRLLGELHLMVLSNEQFLELLRLLLPTNIPLEFLLVNIQVFQNFMHHLAYEYFGTHRYEVRMDIQENNVISKIFVDKKMTKSIEVVLKDYIQFIEKTLINLHQNIIQMQDNDNEDQKIKESKDQFIKLKDSYRIIMDCLGQYDPTKKADPEEILNLQNKDFQMNVDDSDCFTVEERRLYTQLIVIKEIQEVNSNLKKDFSSIEIVDQMALEFVNQKLNRKKLFEDIINFRQNYIILMPLQCRLLATLSRHYKEVEEETTKCFLDLYKNCKMNEHQDKKSRYLRYICELTKFRVLKQDIILEIFQSLLEDIIQQNVELIVILLENCGRFLKYSQESSKKFEFLMNQLDKQRKLKPLGQQQDSLFTKALLSFDRTDKPKKEKPLIQQYVKYLVFDKLDQFELALNSILQLPLNILAVKQYLIKQLIKITVKGKFSTLQLVAGLLAAIREKYPDITGPVVDALIEEIQCGLEDNNINKRQRRITITKMMAELYAYQIVDKALLFRLLYQIIDYGHDTPDSELLDPSDDSFRINQVISLVESLREYYKQLKPQLITFLVYFQRYVLSKKYLPQIVEFSLLDLYENVDNRIVKIKTIKSAEQLCQLNEQQLEEELNKLPDQSTKPIQFDKKTREDQKEQEQQKLIEQDLDLQYQKYMKEMSVVNEISAKKQAIIQNKKILVIKGTGDVKILSKVEQQSTKKKLQKNEWLGFYQ